MAQLVIRRRPRRVFGTVQMRNNLRLSILVPRWIKDTVAWSLAQNVKNEGFTSIVVCALIQRGRVLRGPFKGMRLKKSFGSVLHAKIIGTYELELQKAVQDLVERKPKIAFVIGAAEGYYAVGLARACESISVYAWEADARARSLLENTARVNGVEITVRGVCTPQELLECAIGSYPDVVICDIEGAEIELFTEEVTAALNKTSFIIETHRKEENKSFWRSSRSSSTSVWCLVRRGEKLRGRCTVGFRARKNCDIK